MEILKRIWKLLISIEVMMVLAFIFAISSAVATFIENDFGTQSAWAVVYGARWFEVVQILLGINLLANIFKYKMINRKKIPLLMFHIGFIFILIGAGLTRYFGFEGILHIREGSSSNEILSLEPYLQIRAIKDGKKYSIKKHKLFSELANPKTTLKLELDDAPLILKVNKFINHAKEAIVEDKNGKPIIELRVLIENGAKDIILKEGEVKREGNIVFGLNRDLSTFEKWISFKTKDGKFYISSNQKISTYDMINQKESNLNNSDEVKKVIYMAENIKFVPKTTLLKAKESLISGGKKAMALSAILATIEYKGEKRDIIIRGNGRGTKGLVTKESLGGVNFEFEWGGEYVKLPFALKLRDFQLERYPGSMSPSSYASEITLIDKKNGKNFDYRIYMNHVLDYGGYRFFQSSYDRDERGTILSVNRDPGKWPTYIGYLLLGLGFFFNILNPNSRFRKLAKLIQKDTLKGVSSSLLFILLFIFSTSLKANDLFKKIDKTHADKFGTLLIQSSDGRIKPINTLAIDILNKLYRKTSLMGLDANQIFLSMLLFPKEWENIKVIKVTHPKLKKILGMKESEDYASLNLFFDNSRNISYILYNQVNEAYRKKPSERDKFDKDLLKVDERVNILYTTMRGGFMRFIPQINDPTHTWHTIQDAFKKFPPKEAELVRQMMLSYFDALNYGIEKGDWRKADKFLNLLKSYQKKLSSSIIPSENRIEMEILYNKLNIFNKLILVYLLGGLILLFFIFLKMVKPNLNIDRVIKIIFYINVVAFIIHTLGLLLRWYISNHAPWSDSFESMIFIAWSLALAGITFSKQSTIALALTSILTGVTLFVAHLSFIDPQITNLVPVLKSYWLNIHVSVITSSYGFLGLSSLLGFFTLILITLRNKSNYKEISKSITEATRINEMSIILGLSLLTFGNFLGGVWANESWGRYWGWDPKETWAWISILIYVIVAHLRLIPKIKKDYEFYLAFASTIAYSSIIMTYFGVNFYLSGMHSYASGDPIPIPSFVYWITAIVFITSAVAFFRNKEYPIENN